MHVSRFLAAWRPHLRLLLTALMVGMGTMHVVRPAFFVGIVPSVLPSPHALVLVSGAFEVALGVALLVPGVPRVRRLASYGLVALLVAVFPANINMVMHPAVGSAVPLWALWARLPLQAVFIAWALFVGGPGKGHPDDRGASAGPVSRLPGTSRAP